jgi:hypothetical protein
MDIKHSSETGVSQFVERYNLVHSVSEYRDSGEREAYVVSPLSRR